MRRAVTPYYGRPFKTLNGSTIETRYPEHGIEDLPVEARVEDVLEAEELKMQIHRFLESQPSRDRSIFLRRFFFLEDAKTIARRYGMQEGNVRTVLTRMRKKLRVYLEKEAYDL